MRSAREIGHFQVVSSPLLRTRKTPCKDFILNTSFHSHANRSNIQLNEKLCTWTHLKEMRLKQVRKWLLISNDNSRCCEKQCKDKSPEKSTVLFSSFHLWCTQIQVAVSAANIPYQYLFFTSITTAWLKSDFFSCSVDLFWPFRKPVWTASSLNLCNFKCTIFWRWWTMMLVRNWFNN